MLSLDEMSMFPTFLDICFLHEQLDLPSLAKTDVFALARFQRHGNIDTFINLRPIQNVRSFFLLEQTLGRWHTYVPFCEQFMARFAEALDGSMISTDQEMTGRYVQRPEYHQS